LLACFSRLFAHTTEGGIVVVDVVSPRFMASQDVGVEVLVREGVNPLTGLSTWEFNRKLAIDKRRRIVRVEHTYVEQQGNAEERYRFRQDYHWLEHDEGMDLLRRVGFVDVEALGDYDGCAYSQESPRLILKGRR
jgi:hypothetical protein